ncbi:MAG: radical SAM protein [Desulfuromonadales bacterium]|nr:radical SAM protein [Desulfuromonadales bacterium]
MSRWPGQDLLLIHPPAAKPAEPPLGMASLLGHLRGHGFTVAALDANLEAYLYLLETSRLEGALGPSPSRALQRAVRHARSSLDLLRSPESLQSFARYSTAVHHLNQALSVYNGEGGRERLTLGDYQHGDLSEFSPADLDRAAAGEVSTLFAPYFREQVLPQLEEQRPRWVALSVNYRHQVLPAFELAGMIRRQLPDIGLVGGGGMFTSWKPFLQQGRQRFTCFDHIGFGPGEAVLGRLLDGPNPAGAYDLEDSSAIAFTPDYSFAPFARYLSPVPVLPLAASRGCYWQKCLFCPEATSPTHPWAAVGDADFVPWLLELSARYGTGHLHLSDNAIPPRLLRAMAARADEMAALRWHGFVRFEKALLDPHLVQDLAAGGCRLLQLGLESGSQAVLDRLGKGTRLTDVSAILRNLQRAGIATYVYIMLGTPGETEADAEATRRFLEEHAEAVTFLNVAIMNLPRQSEMLTRPDDFGIEGARLPADRESLGLYETFQASSGWGRREARRFLQQRLLASPAVRAMVNRVPPLFTSSHAFLFC